MAQQPKSSLSVSPSRILLGAAIAAAGSTSTVAWSQTADSMPLEEIVVTASKRSQRLVDFAGSISVQTGEEIARRRAQNMEDLFKVEPGVTLQKTSPDQAFPVIRGINTGSALNLVTVPVGLYLGDVPISDPQNPQSVPDINPVDLETLEVLKGPQGALYGANALAGAVRYVFRRPELDQPFTGDVDLAVTDTAGGSAGYRASAVLNFANSGESAGVRLAGWSTTTPGYIDNVTAGKDESNDWESYGARIVGLYRPTDALSFTLIAMTQTTQLDDYFLVDDPDSLTRTGNPTLSDMELQTNFANLIVEYEFDNGLLFTSNTGYLDKERSTRLDFTNGGLFCANFLGVLGLPVSVPYCQVFDVTTGEQFFQELRVSGDLGSRLNFVLGASYQTAETHPGNRPNKAFYLAPGFTSQITPFLPPGITPDMLGPEDSYLYGEAVLKNKETAVFGEAEFSVTDQLSLTAGGRYWRNTSELPVQYFNGYYTFLFFNPGSLEYSNTFPESTEDGFAPRFSVLYRLSDRQSIYAVASRGYRFGGVNVIPEIGATEQGKYETDTLWNYEIGYRGNLTDTFYLDAAVYYMDWSDAQIQVTGADNFQRVRNAGKAEVTGIEAGVTWNLTEAFELRVAAAYNDAQLAEDLVLSPILTIPDGTAMPGTPEFSMSASADYSFNGPWGSLGDIVLTYSHSDEYYFDIEQTAEVGGYDLVDLRFALQFENLEFSLFGTNLTDEREAAGASTLPTLKYSVLTPRTIGMGVRYSF